MSASNCENPADSWYDIDKRLQWMEAQLRREREDLAHTSAHLKHVLERLARHPRSLATQPQLDSAYHLEGLVALPSHCWEPGVSAGNTTPGEPRP